MGSSGGQSPSYNNAVVSIGTGQSRDQTAVKKSPLFYTIFSIGSGPSSDQTAVSPSFYTIFSIGRGQSRDPTVVA